jgi:hypothetical protein
MNAFPAYPTTQMADDNSNDAAAHAARAIIDPAQWTHADSSVDVLLRTARAQVDTTEWVWYQVGEDLHLAGQGDASQTWPCLLTADTFHAFCTARRLCLWPTGSGESILGWLLAPASHAGSQKLSDLARSLGEALQTDALARAQTPSAYSTKSPISRAPCVSDRRSCSACTSNSPR